MTPFTRFVMACVRGWTRTYTWRLPPAVREARREQIESDLWESAHDSRMTQRELVVQMMGRLTLGIGDDLAWRSTHVTVTRSAALRTVTAAALVSMPLLFVALSRHTTYVPQIPETPLWRVHLHTTRPDPPPPPPRAPAARPAGQPVFTYGRTSYSVVADGPPPVRISAVQPVYPPVAVAASLEGEVVVQARITEHGRVTHAEVAPAGILGQSAIDAVQQWTFANVAQRSALLTVRVSFARSHDRFEPSR
jgi:TonB family protein